jgi:hypothetical protein
MCTHLDRRLFHPFSILQSKVTKRDECKKYVEITKSMKIITFGLIISVLAISNLALTSLPVLQASSSGLKLYLTVDTNLRSQDIRIDTEQYGTWIHSDLGFLTPGLNEYTLQYPRGLIENGDFRICVTVLGDDWYKCGNGYNSSEKKPEHLFISLGERNAPIFDPTRSQSQGENQEQSQSQSQSNDQSVVIYNCPPDSKCVIEQ